MLQAYVHLLRPTRLSQLLQRATPYIAVVTAIVFAAGAYLSFFFAPQDYQQGETVRIMFVHVPAAWWASMLWFAMAVCSLLYLVRRYILWALLSASLAPAGAVCAFSALVSGSIWGAPTWGTFWQWGDARIITTFVLGLFYLGYLTMPLAVDNSTVVRRMQAYCALVGSLNLPLIRFSVDWWQTLHQPASIIRTGGVAMHEAFLWPLFTMVIAVGLACCLISVMQLRTRLSSHRAEVRLQKYLTRNETRVP